MRDALLYIEQDNRMLLWHLCGHVVFLNLQHTSHTLPKQLPINFQNFVATISKWDVKHSYIL